MVSHEGGGGLRVVSFRSYKPGGLLLGWSYKPGGLLLGWSYKPGGLLLVVL